MAIADPAGPRTRAARVRYGLALTALLPAWLAAQTLPPRGGAPSMAPTDGAVPLQDGTVPTDPSATIGTGAAGTRRQGAALSPETRRTTVVPGIRASALGTNNIDLEPKGSQKNGTLLEVVPYVEAIFNSPGLVGMGYYGLRLQDRLGGRDEGRDARNDLRAWADFRIVPDRFRILTQATVTDVVVSPYGSSSFDPGAQRSNRTQYKEVGLAPYLFGRFDGEGTWFAQYAALVVDPGSTFQRSVAQSVRGDVRSDLVARRVGWQVRAEYYDVAYDGGVAYTGAETDLLGWWRPAMQLRVGAGAAYSRNELLADEQGRKEGWGPALAFEWAPDQRTFVTGRWADRYYGNSGELRASYRGMQSIFGLRYFSGLTDGNRVGRVGLNTGSLFNASQQPGTPTTTTSNGVSQALFDQNLLGQTSTSLGSGLVNSPLVYADELVASIGWIGLRDSLVGDVFVNNRRTAVAFSGIQPENTEQRGASLSYLHKLTPRARVTLSGRRQFTESLIDGSTATLDSLFLNLDYKLSPKLVTSLGGRLQRQKGEGLAVSYEEAALFGAIDYRF
jgi:uncharacterized protein (PEP-CTERM system associated)